MSVLAPIRRRLGRKLFLSHVAVVGVGVIVLLLAVELSIPRSFNRHMVTMQSMMGDMGSMPMDMRSDLYTTFRTAVNESLLTAVGSAAVVAVTVSLFISRTVVEPIRAMTSASQRVAQGEYRNPPAGCPDQGTRTGAEQDPFQPAA